MRHCPDCPKEHYVGLGKYVPCPGCGHDALIADLEAKLAAAQAELIRLCEEHAGREKHGLVQIVTERDALKATLAEVQFVLRSQQTYFNSALDAALRIISKGEAERDSLRAMLEQAREALLKFGCTHPWVPGSMAVVTNEPTCREFTEKRPDVWTPKQWCYICVALDAIDKAKGVANQVLFPNGCLLADSTAGPPGGEYKVRETLG